MKITAVPIFLILSLPLAAGADSGLPVENGIVTSGVGWRSDPFGSGKLGFHRGVDIAVPVGTPVRAMRKGQVVFAGERGSYGRTVIVVHSNGDRTLYGHNSILRVARGDLVEAGAILAFSGNSGRSTGPHVHYEQIAGGRPIVDEEEVVQNAGLLSERHLLEQKMEESVNSILRTINNRSGTPGQGG